MLSVCMKRLTASTYFLFFFQAEDGIRDLYVTGVQTCALPILPATELVLVEQAEVEEAGDGGLAVREQDRVPKLRGLVDDAGFAVPIECRHGMHVVLAAVVVTPLVGRRNRLEAVLHVPDAHAAGPGHGLRRSLERGLKDVHQRFVVALSNEIGVLVQDPGRLGG